MLTGRCGGLRWLGGGSCQSVGVDLEFGLDKFCDHTGPGQGGTEEQWGYTISFTFIFQFIF